MEEEIPELPVEILLKIAQLAHLMEIQQISDMVYAHRPRNKFAFHVHATNVAWEMFSRCIVHCNCNYCTYTLRSETLVTKSVVMCVEEI